MKRHVPPENPWPFFLALTAILASSFLSRDEFPAWLRTASAVGSGFAWLYFFISDERRKAREGDERELRIRAEGRALGFNLLLAALLLWIPLDRADVLQLGFTPLLVLIAATYLIGPWLARRRYS
jgi:hypothetical protein